MKKIIIVIVVIICVLPVFSQISNVTSAGNYLKDGFLADAKMSIEKAELNVKTKDWYKTYYYKGQIYHELGLATKPKYQALCDNCLDIAFESYVKSLKLNLKKPEHQAIDIETEVGLMEFLKILQERDESNYESSSTLLDIILNQLPALSNAFINQGVELYQKNDFESSYLKFEKAILISSLTFKADTQLYYFTSLAALEAEKFEEAIKLNDILMQLDFGETDDDKASICLNQAIAYKLMGDTVKMLEALETGISKYPNASYLLVLETFNFYVTNGENDKAFEYLNIAIEQNPIDPQFYVIKGTLLEELGRKNEAQREYDIAIVLQPDNFDANYSLGAFYYNTAVDTLDWAEKNILISDFQKLEEFKKIANNFFEQALPYLEKANIIQPKNIDVLGTLRVIYYRLARMEEYEKVKAEIEVLTE